MLFYKQRNKMIALGFPGTTNFMNMVPGMITENTNKQTPPRQTNLNQNNQHNRITLPWQQHAEYNAWH